MPWVALPETPVPDGVTLTLPVATTPTTLKGCCFFSNPFVEIKVVLVVDNNNVFVDNNNVFVDNNNVFVDNNNVFVDNNNVFVDNNNVFVDRDVSVDNNNVVSLSINGSRF